MGLINFAVNINFLRLMENLNRLKVVLAESRRTGKWLAEQLGKDPVTVSKWCTNTTQPDIYTMAKISDILNVDIRELLISRNQKNI